MESVKSMVRKGRITGIQFGKQELEASLPSCRACAKGKMTRALFPKSTHDLPDSILICVSTDLWGPAQVQTPSGK